MPDPSRKTVSATELPALFGESPYLTRWLLWQKFVNGAEIVQEEHERMVWGTLMQPLIAQKVARDMGLVVEHNDAETYHRRGNLGCSRDAQITHPERGRGALEIKCVFDMKQWMARWHGGDLVPRDIELQHQTQMFVGDETGPFEWGLIAAWVCAKMYYFERKPLPELWHVMSEEAGNFLDSCYGPNAQEPDPAGAIIELPLLAQLYPTVEGSVIDWHDIESAQPYTDKVRTYLGSAKLKNTHDKVTDSIRAEFIGVMRDAELLLLPDGARVRLKTDKRGARRMDAWMPQEG